MPVKPFTATVTDNRLHSGVCRQSLGSDAGTGMVAIIKSCANTRQSVR